MRRAHGSPAEARLAWRIGRGESLDVLAQEKWLTHETIRSRLKSVFLKTGTHRQNELLLLVRKLPFSE